MGEGAGRLTQTLQRGVSVELRLRGTLVRRRQLSQVVERVMEGRLALGVVVFAGQEGASSRQLSVVHTRGDRKSVV